MQIIFNQDHDTPTHAYRGGVVYKDIPDDQAKAFIDAGVARAANEPVQPKPRRATKPKGEMRG